MKKDKFDTIYEQVLAASLKLMYYMREDRKNNLDSPAINYYRKVLEEIKKNEGAVEYPERDDINHLYESDEIERDTSEKQDDIPE